MRIQTLLTAASFVLLSACGGGSDSKVGQQDDAAPIARASVFGANVMTDEVVEVRSGSEVLLSGQSSDGIDDPILQFSWEQTDDSEYQVEFYERTSNAVVFTAPKIPVNLRAGVELDFMLTVVDADGVEVSDEVRVRVLPAHDANHFLLRPDVEETFAFVVAPSEGVSLDANIPVSVDLSHTISWVDRFGNSHEREFEMQGLSGVVVADAVDNVLDPSSLYFLQAIPLLDFDEVNKSLKGELRSERLEFENVEAATLTVRASLNQQGGGELDFQLARKGETGLELIDTSTVRIDANTFEFDSEWMRQQIGVESELSGNNYYNCIDPTGQSRTLSGWLEQAGFVEGVQDVYHTAYVNNYDLNFGRDMFVRTDEFGNVYSYVSNYPSLENTLSRRNDFAVVVMEFSPAPTGNCGDNTFTENDGGEKIVKFYSYVPDKNTGEYVRAPTMNFDGRGERAVPGVCVACHFGGSNTDDFNVADYHTVDASAADLNSSFMPWDLDAYLFTVDADSGQVDPVYAANSISDDVTQTFSRESQEANFRAQNQATLHTFTYDIHKLKRYETAIKLMHGLYGNGAAVDGLNFGTEDEPLTEEQLIALQAQVSTLPANVFDGETYNQPGWDGQEELYHRVFARNCRLCHAQMENQSIDFDSYEEFINNERLTSYVYEMGIMPLSRLTMDRFWTDFYGNISAAEYLRQHLNSDANQNNDVGADVVPGYPIAVVSPGASPELDADITLDFGERVLFDGTDSFFADRYQWRVNGLLRSTDSRFSYVADTPGNAIEISLVAFSSEQVVTSEEEVRRISVANNVPNASGVPNQSVVEGETVQIDIFSALCASEPDAVACRSVFGDIREGEVPLLEIVGTPVNGLIAELNAEQGLVSFESTAAEVFGAGSFNFTLTDSFGEQSEVATVIVNVSGLDGPVIVGPDTCTVPARTYATELEFPQEFNTAECPDPSDNDTIGGDLSLEVVEVDGSLQNGASLSVSNGLISYSPARFFTGNENFAYTVQDDSLSARTSEGSVSVTVQATATYSDVAAGLFNVAGDGGCADCHDGNTAGAPNWQNAAVARLAAASTDVDLVSAELTLAEPTTVAQLLSGIFFVNACSEATHPGGNRLCLTPGAPTSTADLNDDGLLLLEWIEQGTP